MKPSGVERDIQEIADGLGEEAKAFSGRSLLLCGGAGFLGRYFVTLFSYLNDQVLPHPCRVVVCDNLITSGAKGADVIPVDGFRFFHHDIVKSFDIDEPIDYVIQAAGIASPYYYRKFPLETLEVATIGTKHMLMLGVKHAVKGLLFFSSSEVYGNPDPAHIPTPESYRGNVSCLGPRACYDESKRLGETLCGIFHELHGVPAKIVRPFNVYGPGMEETDYRMLPNLASRITANKPVRIYSHGRQTRTFCYVTDAMVGFIKVLLNGTPGQAYNIGTPAPEISMLELVDIVGQVVGRPVEVRLVDYPDTYPADEPQRRCPDVRKASVQLNYRPTVPLEEGLRRFLEWTGRHYRGAPF